MTLAISLTGLDLSNPIPGQYIEVRFAQGATGGDLGPKRALIIAPKDSGGTITADTQIVGPISDEADAITYAAAGSPAHRMIRAFLAVNKSVELYLICPTEASGTATVDKIIYATTAAANGSTSVWICGEQIDVPIVTGDTATVIGDNVAAAINNRTHLPLIATNASGTITLDAKIIGVEVNSARFRAKINGTGVATTVSPTLDKAFGASGASGAAASTDLCSYTTALTTLLGRKFHYIIPHAQTSAALSALMTQVDVQAEPSTGFRQKVIAACALAPSDANTLASGSSLNRPRATFVNAEESPEEHYVLAAKVAAAIIKEELSDPSYNFDGYGTRDGQVLPLLAPYNDTAKPTTAELKLMLNSGVTPISYTDGGQPFIVRAVTTRCKSGSNFDYRARDRIVVAVGDRFADDMAARYAAAPWRKVTADPVGAAREPAPEFATPRRVKAMIEQLVSDYVDFGWLDPAKKQTTLDGIQVGQDPLLPSRMNASVPLYSAVLLHQHALLVKESSQAT